MAMSSELRKRYDEENRFARDSGAALESNIILGMQQHSSTISGSNNDGLKLGKVLLKWESMLLIQLCLHVAKK